MRRVAGLGLVLVLGCTGAETASPDAGAAPATFIAQTSHFQAFRTWEVVDLGPVEPLLDGGLRDEDGGLRGDPHGNGGNKRVYINAPPAGGGTLFPVGTIIVKAVEHATPQEWEIHAMVKRGGDYNRAGAVGWEWFDLAVDVSDRVAIVWRGLGNDTYGGLHRAEDAVDCNACHVLAAAHDHVFTQALWP
jgi:hypothetical protein